MCIVVEKETEGISIFFFFLLFCTFTIHGVNKNRQNFSFPNMLSSYAVHNIYTTIICVINKNGKSEKKKWGKMKEEKSKRETPFWKPVCILRPTAWSRIIIYIIFYYNFSPYFMWIYSHICNLMIHVGWKHLIFFFFFFIKLWL